MACARRVSVHSNRCRRTCRHLASSLLCTLRCCSSTFCSFFSCGEREDACQCARRNARVALVWPSLLRPSVAGARRILHERQPLRTERPQLHLSARSKHEISNRPVTCDAESSSFSLMFSFKHCIHDCCSALVSPISMYSRYGAHGEIQVRIDALRAAQSLQIPARAGTEQLRNISFHLRCM
jgi:hypothetical protein